MAARIEDQLMTAEFGGRVIATARYNRSAAAEGQGTWIASGLPAAYSRGTRRSRRWCSRNGSPQGYSDDDLFVIGWREELSL
jgi:hypothetical protein